LKNGNKYNVIPLNSFLFSPSPKRHFKSKTIQEPFPCWVNILFMQGGNAMYNNNFNDMHFGSQPQLNYHDERNIKTLCQRYRNYHVIGQMQDGTQVEGIIEDMDNDGVTMLVPEMVEEDDFENRQYYGGYGGYRRRYRRYRRRRFPFYQFAFPFIFPFPFYY
jgi:hypothetical protein